MGFKSSYQCLFEMAYPVEFNMEDFKKLKSFSNKQKYAKEKLLGKLGAGSARAVFKIDDEKVLKVAVNEKGIAQNEQEAEGYKQNYDILARVFDVDKDDMWLEMELAKKVTKSRFKTLTGVSLDDLQAYLIYRDRGSRFIDKDLIAKLDENGFIQDLMSFVGDYDYSIPGDFARASTYGEVLRDGKPKIVVIDFGLSKDVLDTYYRR